MREVLRDRNRLEHMLEQICKAEDAAKGFTFEQFENAPIRLLPYIISLRPRILPGKKRYAVECYS